MTPATRLIFLNSPANPTGFVATREEIAETLAIARRHGLWIIADEIYGRITYDGARAPSFHDVMAPDDKIMFVQTLSKNWAMTGFRVGWLEAPAALGEVIENLIQFTTSGVPVFTQRAAIAALEEGEAFLAWQIERCRRARDTLCQGLKATGRVRFFEPEAAFYLFCAVEGFPDSRALALRLIDEAGVGAAPGGAFGPGGEGHLRLCFARDPVRSPRRRGGWRGGSRGDLDRAFPPLVGLAFGNDWEIRGSPVVARLKAGAARPRALQRPRPSRPLPGLFRIHAVGATRRPGAAQFEYRLPTLCCRTRSAL